MRLLGREVEAFGLAERVAAALRARSEPAPEAEAARAPAVEARVDPLQHALQGLTEHADPAQGLPLATHRAGLGRGVLVMKQLFRTVGRPFIQDLFGRQRLFNGHVRDAYASLSAEVERLRAEVDALRRPPAKPKARSTRSRK